MASGEGSFQRSRRKAAIRDPRKLADALCRELRVLQPGRYTHWVTLKTVAHRLGLVTDEAHIAAKEAVARCQIRAVGEPIHTVSLILGLNELPTQSPREEVENR